VAVTREAKEWTHDNIPIEVRAAKIELLELNGLAKYEIHESKKRLWDFVDRLWDPEEELLRERELKWLS